MDYYLATKEGNFIFEITWMNLEDIMLSDINLTQKDKYSMISFI